jgi:O-antigen chain-terminating methyltransferase
MQQEVGKTGTLIREMEVDKRAMDAKLFEIENKLAEAADRLEKKLKESKREIGKVRTAFHDRLEAASGQLMQVEKECGWLAGRLATDLETEFYAYFQQHIVSADYIRNTAAYYAGIIQKSIASCIVNPEQFFLDVGCGQGELIRSLSLVGIPCKGVDTNRQFVDLCIANGFHAEHVDALSYVSAMKANTLSGMAMLQVIEHMDFRYALKLVQQIYRVTMPNGVVLIETVNPYSLTTLSRFWLDYTHKIPLVPELIKLLLEFTGFKDIETHYINKQGGESGLAHHQHDGNILQDVIYGFSDYYVLATR